MGASWASHLPARNVLLLQLLRSAPVLLNRLIGGEKSGKGIYVPH